MMATHRDESPRGDAGPPTGQQLAEYTDIHFLDPGQASFRRTEGGLLALELASGESYGRVNLFPGFPLSRCGEYISVRDPEDKEIGIIRNVTAFSGESRRALEKELDCRFFTPNIIRIRSVKEEFGYSYWEVETDRGERRFTVRNSQESIVPLTETRLLILDIDGNRFEIPDCRQLDPKSFRYIDDWL